MIAPAVALDEADRTRGLVHDSTGGVGRVPDEFTLVLVGISADLAMFSVLRLARLLRLTRLMRMLPELQMMVWSLSRAISSVNSTLLLLVMITYVFAIIIVDDIKTILKEGVLQPDGVTKVMLEDDVAEQQYRSMPLFIQNLRLRGRP